MNALSTNAYDSALQGIQRGLARENASASAIASQQGVGTANPTDLAKSIVELKLGVQQVEASAKVIKAVDEGLGSLLDDLA